MANYDSDSSGDEDYTETNVLLGYASREPTDDTISQLGGHPTWLDEHTAAPGNLAKCKVCNGLLTLLLQLNGDLPERFPGHERRLYLLGCKRKTCRRKDGSVRGFRATRAGKTSEPEHPQQQAPASPPAPALAQQRTNIGESLFGVKSPSASSSNTNPFSTSSATAGAANPFSTSSSSSNPFSSASLLAAKPAQPPSTTATSSLSETFASKARISSPPPESAPLPGPAEPWPAQNSFPTPYPTYYLDADYETLDSTPSSIPSQARVDMDIDGGEASSSGGADTKEVFESSMDKTFQKFADRVGQNPEQVLRYEFGSQPLLYSKDDRVGKMLSAHADDEGGGRVRVVSNGAKKSGMPRCGNCGAERVFEVQLTPHAITELEAEELGLEGMEWGTAILGVCAKDCVAKGVREGEVGYVEEWVGVQWEEQVSKR